MIIAKKSNLRATIYLVLSSFLVAHLCFWILPNLFETWDAKAVDRLFLFRSSSPRLEPPYNDTIVHVDLSDRTLQKLDRFYLNRSVHARVIRNLAAMNTSVLLYDFIFAARTNEEEDRALIRATEEAGNVHFGLAFRLVEGVDRGHQKPQPSEGTSYLNRTTWHVMDKGETNDLYTGVDALMTFPALASAARGLGYLSLKYDGDGVFRRLPLLVRYEDGVYPSFALRGVCDYLRVPPERVVVEPGKRITLKGVERPGKTEPFDIQIPVDRLGNMVVNFIGPWERMRHYDFADVLRASEDRDEMEMWREELSGKVVLVSEVLTGSSDLGTVPTDANLPLSGVHANAIHTILTGSFLKELTDLQMLMVELCILAAVFFLSLRLSSLFFSLGTLGVAAAYVGVVVVGFLSGHLIFQIIRPLFMVGFALIGIVTYRYIKEEKERNFIRTTFGRYLSREVVEELLDSPEGLKISGKLQKVTFLVSDLRGFTALSMKLSPHEVIDTLNRYLERMVEIIAYHRGTVNEIEGDGILAFFGAPLVGDDDEERAIACALAMQNAMDGINAAQKALNLPRLGMGIRINSGEVVVGNIGSEKRAKYSAIGSAINTAFRIESYTVGGQILISPTTHGKVKESVQIQGSMEVQFKGIDHPVTLYDVVGIGGRYQVSLPVRTAVPLAKLDPPVPITCFVLEGKTVSDAPIGGLITHLGDSAAQVFMEQPVEVRSNLKVLVALGEGLEPPEVYAKVISREPSDPVSSQHSVRVEFTWLPDDVVRFFEERRSGP